MVKLVRENPYIEIGGNSPLASLEDFYRLRGKSIYILVEDRVINLTSYIMLAAEKAIPRSKTYKYF